MKLLFGVSNCRLNLHHRAQSNLRLRRTITLVVPHRDRITAACSCPLAVE